MQKPWTLSIHPRFDLSALSAVAGRGLGVGKPLLTTIPRVLGFAALLALGAIAVSQQELEVRPRPGYLLYLPKKAWGGKKWPLILYLHGRSQRGTDLALVRRNGLPNRLTTDRGFPFIVVSPQLPQGQRWTDTRLLSDLVDDIARRYPIDRSRVYAMGFSMGASGVWRVAHDRPGQFAAIVSVGGIYEPQLAASGRMTRVAAWVLHGSADKEAPIDKAKEIAELHRKKGGESRFTSILGLGHVPTGIFERSDLYQWLLRHKIGKR